MSRAGALSKTVTGWVDVCTDWTGCPTVSGDRRTTMPPDAAIDFGLSRDSCEEPVRHPLDAAHKRVSPREAPRHRLTHVVRAPDTSPLPKVGMTGVPAGHTSVGDPDRLRRLPTAFQIGSYGQVSDRNSGCKDDAPENHQPHAFRECQLRWHYGWIRSGRCGSGRLRPEALDSASGREALRSALATLSGQVDGTQCAWRTPIPPHGAVAGRGFNALAEDGCAERLDDGHGVRKHRYSVAPGTRPGCGMCSDPPGLVFRGEDRTYPEKQVWTHPNREFQTHEPAGTRACGIVAVRRIEPGLDCDGTGHDRPRAVGRASTDLPVEVAEAFGLGCAVVLTHPERLADGPRTFWQRSREPPARITCTFGISGS